MIRYLTTLPLLGAMMFLTPGDSNAQLGRHYPPAVPPTAYSLAGTYENISSGGYAQIYQHHRGYIFVNEHGARAKFVYTAPGRLEMIRGEWAPTLATVGQDRFGQTLIRFDSSGPPGYWLRVG